MNELELERVRVGLVHVLLLDDVDPVGAVPVDVTFEDVSGGPVDDGGRVDEVKLVRLLELEPVVRLAELEGVDVSVVPIDEEFVYVAVEGVPVEFVLGRVLRVITLVYRLRVEDGSVEVKLELLLVEDGVAVDSVRVVLPLLVDDDSRVYDNVLELELSWIVLVDAGYVDGGGGGQVVTVLFGISELLLSVEGGVVVLLHNDDDSDHVVTVPVPLVPVPLNEEVVTVLFGGPVLLGTVVLFDHDVDSDHVDIVPVPLNEEVVVVSFSVAVLLRTVVVFDHNDDPDHVDTVPVPLKEGDDAVLLASVAVEVKVDEIVPPVLLLLRVRYVVVFQYVE